MRGVWPFPVAAVLLLFSGAAQAEGFAGQWCGRGDAPFMGIDEYGVGFGDHVVCDWDQPFPHDALSWVVELSCRAVHVIDIKEDGTMEVVEDPRPPMTFGFYLANEDVLVSSSMGEDGIVMTGFDRCG